MLAGLSNWLLETGAKDESLVVAGEALDKFIDVFSEDTQVHNSVCMTRMRIKDSLDDMTQDEINNDDPMILNVRICPYFCSILKLNS